LSMFHSVSSRARGKLKNVFMLDLFQLLSSPDVSWWTGAVWIIVMFLSDSHSDGTHSLQSIRCWDTDAETHFSKSDEETNSSKSLIAWGRAHFQLILAELFLYGQWFCCIWWPSATQCMVGLSQTVHAESSQQHWTFNKCFCTSPSVVKASALADFAKVSKSKCRAVFIVKLLWNSTFCETRFTNTTKWIPFTSV